MDWIDKLFEKWDRKREEEEKHTKEEEEQTMLYLMSREIDAEREHDPFYLGW